jgi:chromosome segregation ATPase
MPSKKVSPVDIVLSIKGSEKLQKLNSSFRDLSKQLNKLSAGDLQKATDDVRKFAAESGNSEATIKAQIKAFEGLRSQAAMGGKVYRELGEGIVDLKASLDGLGAKSQARAKNLEEIGTSAKSSVSQIKQAIEELKLLSKEARTGSDAFARLKGNIAGMGEALEAAEGKAKKQREISNLLNGTLRKNSTLIGLQAKAYRERVAVTEKEIQSIDLLSSKERSTAANTEKRIRLEEKLQQQLLKVAQTGYLEFVASSRSETIKLAEAFSNTDKSIASFGVRLKALDKDFGKLPNTTAGFNQKLAELQIELNNTVRSSDQYVAVALRIAQVQREATATAQGLGAALVKDLASGNTVRNQKNLREAIGQLQAEMNELNTETAEGSSKYAENARQVNNLQKELNEIAGSYRNVTDMAMQASTAQGVYANTSVGNNYLRRGIVRQQEAARAELGAAVRAGVASTQLALPAAGQTTAPGTGLERSGGAEPYIPESSRGFAQESFAQLQGPRQYLPGPALPPGFAEKLRQRNISEAESLRKLNEEKGIAKKVSEDLAASVSKARIANNDSINSVNRLRSALDEQRSTLPRSSKAFKELSDEIDALDRRSEKVSRRMSRRRFSPGKAAQVAGATISGGIFGGPEGFLGGAIGGAIGGVGGSFAGSALGAQVGQLRQQLGGLSMRRALRNSKSR